MACGSTAFHRAYRWNGRHGATDANPGKTAALIAKIPLGRYGRIPEIADMALFLSSESAGYITGTILDCDGGGQLLSTSGELG